MPGTVWGTVTFLNRIYALERQKKKLTKINTVWITAEKEISRVLEQEKESEVAQLCPTLCDPVDCNLPGSSVHGILQAKILEWIAISFSRGSSQPRDRTLVSCTARRRFNLWATYYLKAVRKGSLGETSHGIAKGKWGQKGPGPSVGRAPGEPDREDQRLGKGEEGKGRQWSDCEEPCKPRQEFGFILSAV